MFDSVTASYCFHPTQRSGHLTSEINQTYKNVAYLLHEFGYSLSEVVDHILFNFVGRYVAEIAVVQLLSDLVDLVNFVLTGMFLEFTILVDADIKHFN